MQKVRVFQMHQPAPIFGPVYEVGHFIKPAQIAETDPANPSFNHLLQSG